jgi:hypothetical protein
MGGFYNPYARSVASDPAPRNPQSQSEKAPRAEHGAANPFSRPAAK